MAGIYIHIPFCRRACHYCDFHFSTNLKNAEDLVEAILKEIDSQSDYLGGQPVSTIYFGGGTPSLLATAQIEKTLNALAKRHSINKNLELTLEANPEDLSVQKLKELQAIGINRLSLGTQSFIDKELLWMNRMHSADQAQKCIRNAQQLGFSNISIDLIFGLPDQTKTEWQHNLEMANSLDIQHVSSYGLTVEKRTVLEKKIRSGEQSAPSEELASEFLLMNMDFFPSNGFEHYETSNYARQGFISGHNSNYWKGVPYLGLGPSAHSFNGRSRQWNVRSNASYISRLADGKPCFEIEELSETDRLNEHILTGLRTKWGIERSIVEGIKKGAWAMLLEEAKNQEDGLFEFAEEGLKLSKRGVLLTDKLTSELFF